MFEHFLQIFWANFKKNTFLFFTGIVSLIIGISICIILVQTVLYEKSFDKHFKNSKNIYRITLDFYNEGNLEVKSCQTFFPVASEIAKQFPEITEYSRIIKMKDNWIFKYKEISLYEDKACIVEKSFLKQFSIKLVKGDTSNIVSKFLVSKSFAKKQFGNEDPIGKILTLKTFLGKWDLEVAGIYEDMAEESHFKFDCMVFVVPSFETSAKNNWGNNFVYSYISVNPQINIKNLEDKITKFINDKKNDKTNKIIAHLQPITNIHLNSALDDEMYRNGNGKMVSMCIMLSIIILLISWFIYLNISSSIIVQRTNEISLKKVIGSSKILIFLQFLFESFVINIINISVGILVAWGIGRYIIMKNLFIISDSLWTNPNFWIITVVFLIFSILISGFISINITSQANLSLVNSVSKKNSKVMLIKKGLVFFQYIISIGIIAGILTIYFQIRHMQNVDLGFDENGVVVLKAVIGRDTSDIRYANLFKEELKNLPGISYVSNTEKVPGDDGLSTSSVKIADDKSTAMKQIYKVTIDYDYVNTLKIKIISGRTYAQNFANESSNVILNETAIKRLGFKSPNDAINKYIFEKSKHQRNLKVIGVIADFHQQYAKFEIQPTMYLFKQATPGKFAIKLSSNKSINETIKSIKQTFTKIFPETPFHYFFLDDYYKSQYKFDWQFAIMMTVLLIVIITLSCIGLLGLSSYSCYQRTKEVGIRRVCGANVTSILLLFYKEYLYFIIYSSIIAFAITYWLCFKWLENYASKIKIGLWFFIIPIVGISLITFITVTYHILKNANTNPTKSIRYQ